MARGLRCFRTRRSLHITERRARPSPTASPGSDRRHAHATGRPVLGERHVVRASREDAVSAAEGAIGGRGAGPNAVVSAGCRCAQGIAGAVRVALATGYGAVAAATLVTQSSPLSQSAPSTQPAPTPQSPGTQTFRFSEPPPDERQMKSVLASRWQYSCSSSTSETASTSSASQLKKQLWPSFDSKENRPVAGRSCTLRRRRSSPRPLRSCACSSHRGRDPNTRPRR